MNGIVFIKIKDGRSLSDLLSELGDVKAGTREENGIRETVIDPVYRDVTMENYDALAQAYTETMDEKEKLKKENEELKKANRELVGKINKLLYFKEKFVNEAAEL